jgi:hypothetical protein
MPEESEGRPDSWGEWRRAVLMTLEEHQRSLRDAEERFQTFLITHTREQATSAEVIRQHQELLREYGGTLETLKQAIQETKANHALAADERKAGLTGRWAVYTALVTGLFALLAAAVALFKH